MSYHNVIMTRIAIRCSASYSASAFVFVAAVEDREREKKKESEKKRKREKEKERERAKQLELEEQLLEPTEDDEEMRKLLGFASFDTTKGKPVAGNKIYVAHKLSKNKYRYARRPADCFAHSWMFSISDVITVLDVYSWNRQCY